MKRLLFLSVLFSMNTVLANPDVIYGEDNRKDIYQVSNPLFLTLSKSTAAMIRADRFFSSSDQRFQNLFSIPTLEISQGICPSEAFSQQPTAATCSGFLVGPDILVTAGHCYSSFDTPENVCKNFNWVFDLNMKSAYSNPTTNIPNENIYRCKRVLDSQLSPDTDFSIIQLDRVVTGRKPLPFRTSGKVSDHASLVVIGHPSGLPSKISDGGKITFNGDPTRFSTTLDTFHGNSGSAVFDARTGLIEGILIQGKTDYVPSISGNPNSCKLLNKCDDYARNCKQDFQGRPTQMGEVVLRITNLMYELSSALRE
jgi:V8-like Glu-specific endopeptidase